MEIIIRLLALVAGVVTVGFALSSALRTFVLPRSANDPLAYWVFRATRRIFDLRARRALTYVERDSIMALYAPVSLLMLPVAWLAIVMLGYTGIFWAAGT